MPGVEPAGFSKQLQRRREVSSLGLDDAKQAERIEVRGILFENGCVQCCGILQAALLMERSSSVQRAADVRRTRDIAAGAGHLRLPACRGLGQGEMQGRDGSDQMIEGAGRGGRVGEFAARQLDVAPQARYGGDQVREKT
jgi:hypothetical protein